MEQCFWLRHRFWNLWISKKTQKSTYLENETLFFTQIKKSLITHQGYFVVRNSFEAEITFNAFWYISSISCISRKCLCQLKCKKEETNMIFLVLTSLKLDSFQNWIFQDSFQNWIFSLLETTSFHWSFNTHIIVS